jgi:hypothetical protein
VAAQQNPVHARRHGARAHHRPRLPLRAMEHGHQPRHSAR